MTGGYLRDLFNVYECFVQMRMIIFGRDELFRLCSMGRAWNIPGLGLVGNSLAMCCSLEKLMSFRRFSTSLRCVSIMSVVILWRVQLYSSRVLQSIM